MTRPRRRASRTPSHARSGRESLDKLLAQFEIKGLSEAEIDHLNRARHRLDPWPDSVPGLTRRKKKFVLATLSNGNVALITTATSATRRRSACARRSLPRPHEHGPGSNRDVTLARPWDVIAKDFRDLAERLGC